MADQLREDLGVEVSLIKGRGGVFKVRVDDAVVARKTVDGFPTPSACVRAVSAALKG